MVRVIGERLNHCASFSHLITRGDTEPYHEAAPSYDHINTIAVHSEKHVSSDL